MKTEKENKEQKPENFGMKTGEYFLHVFIENTSQLYSTDQSTLDPTIAVRCMGKKKQIKAKSGIAPSSTIYWGDHLYFNKVYTQMGDLESELIEVKIFDKNTILKDSLIGSVTINLNSIYQLDNHTAYHQWYVLQNKELNFQKAMGYIQLSINLATGKDSKVFSLLRSQN